MSHAEIRERAEMMSRKPRQVNRARTVVAQDLAADVLVLLGEVDRYREALQDIDAAVTLNGSDALPHIAMIVDDALRKAAVGGDPE